MANFQLFVGIAQVDWRSAFIDALTNGTFTVIGEDLPSVVLKSGSVEVTIEGTDLDVTGARSIADGTLAKVTLTVGGIQVAVIDAFGTPPTAAAFQSILNSPPTDPWFIMNDLASEGMTITGSAARDILLGTAFDDTINVSVDAGPAGEYVRPGLGTNTLVATAFTDEGGGRRGHVLAFVDLTIGITADLGAGTASGTGMSTSFSNIQYIATGHANDSLKGSDALDITYEGFVGNAGNDTIDGGAGTLDIVMYDDEVDYGAATAGGWANGTLGVVVNLATGTAQDSYGDTDTLSNLEGVIGTRFADRITGDSRGNFFVGHQGTDSIKGAGGKDTLDGGDGKDTLEGGNGRDSLSGGLLRDTLTGGGDADRFVFNDIAESQSGSTKRDFITDFKHGTDDIDLSAIDANFVRAGNQSFKFDAAMGTAASAVAKGHIGWYQIDKSGTSGDRTILKINVDNDATIEMQIELKGLVGLTSGDFIL